MTDTRQLPYLVELLDDDSPLVREAVTKELVAFGDGLEEELAKLSGLLDLERRMRLETIQWERRRARLKLRWPAWFRVAGGKEQLESAFEMLAEFQDPAPRAGGLRALLDALAAEFRACASRIDSFELARFLFREKGIEGAQADYYNPQNSNLAYVIENRRGIPISLACVYILVGHRFGLEIEGCNFPGHFLARTTLGGECVLVDCFNGGKFIEARSFLNLSSDAADRIGEFVETKPSPALIIGRVLNNLSNAYNLADDPDNGAFMQELFYAVQTEFGTGVTV